MIATDIVLRVFAASLSLALPALAQQQPPPDEAPAEPPAAGALDPRLREQLHSFLPYLSFDSPLTLGKSRNAATIMAELQPIEEAQKKPLDADPKLRTTSHDIYGLLVSSKDKLIPHLKAAELPEIAFDHANAPELAIGVMFVRQFMEWARVTALSEWQLEVDRRCRQAYQGLLPLVKRVAKGEPGGADAVSIRCGNEPDKWVYIDAIHRMSAPLRRCTLRVELFAIDERSSTHYFYYPEWNADEPKILRPAVEWMGIGAEGTIRAKYGVISDEIIFEGAEAKFDQNIPFAADRALDEIERHIASGAKPRLAQDRLKLINPKLAAFPDRAARAKKLGDAAFSVLTKATDEIEVKIKEKTEKRKDTDQRRTELRNKERKLTGEKNKKQKAQVQDEIEKLDSKIQDLDRDIKDLQKELAEWRSGKR